jgi:hypothetical protein
LTAGPVAYLYGRYATGPVAASLPDRTRRGSRPLPLRGPRQRDRKASKTMTHRRQQVAARRPGKFNRDHGSRRVLSAIDVQRRSEYPATRQPSHGGASAAGELMADRVGEIIARGEFKHAPVRLEIESCNADSVSPPVQARSSRAPLHRQRSRETPPRARSTTAPPRLSRVLRASAAGGHRGERRRETRVRISPFTAGHAAMCGRLSHAAQGEDATRCR